jgi:hypothetical protein
MLRYDAETLTIIYNVIDFVNLYCLEAPLIVTHNVNGSLPSCSFVAPIVLTTPSGTVIGIGVPHLFPVAVYMLMASISSPFAEVVHVMLGLQRSRV